jgi:hypothetical protein
VGVTGSGNGITFNSGGTLNIQNCVIRGFTGTGLALLSTGSADINVANTIASGNHLGISLNPSGTAITVTASFVQVQVIHSGNDGLGVFGTAMTGSLHAIAADSLASGNGGAGFISLSAAGKATPIFTLANSKAANNVIGVQSGNNAAMFLNGSTVSGNLSDGFFVGGGGVINSYGNNAITDTTNSGSLTPVALR